MNMMLNFLSQIIGLVGQAWSWFFSLLDGMGGAAWFITTFLGLFTISRFTDLVLMNFLYSPTSLENTESRINSIRDRLSGD